MSSKTLCRLVGASLIALGGTVHAAVAADVNAGATLVQSNGCAGCHGATFQGGIGPKLYGIEHRLKRERIAAAIKTPKAPMPKFPFSDGQISDVVAYLTSLDGGGGRPVATLSPRNPGKSAVLTVRFPGTPPKHVVAIPVMQMGASSMTTPTVVLHPTGDPHVWTGTVAFSMGGPWTIDVKYDGGLLKLPVTAGSM
ncbi:MAG TPA: cytochrome c [Candidatus Elarobacter sp.]|jgi:mono/diheme cytochrome c family protein|nr:cytochrome c [Candidatus Elarobacter sp.]